MLIDDNEHDNFYHQRVIKKAEVAEKVISYQSAEAALSYLAGSGQSGFIKPDIIFLDINMPRMNGWEFLDEYEKLARFINGSVVLMMLSTSLNPDDLKLASKKKVLSGFLNKPLTDDDLNAMIQKYFPAKYSQNHSVDG